MERRPAELVLGVQEFRREAQDRAQRLDVAPPRGDVCERCAVQPRRPRQRLAARPEHVRAQPRVAEVQGPVQQRRRPEVVVRLPEVDVAQRFDASHISCIDEAAQRLGDDDIARMSACSGGGLQFVEGEGWQRCRKVWLHITAVERCVGVPRRKNSPVLCTIGARQACTKSG